MIGVAWIKHILADVISHLGESLSVFDTLVLEVKNQLVSLVMFSFSTEKLLVELRMSNLELLVRADDCIADFDFFQGIHVEHAELENSVLGQSLPCPRCQSHVHVVFGSSFINHRRRLTLSAIHLTDLSDSCGLNLDCLASDVRLCLLALCSLQLLELFQLLLICLEQLLKSFNLISGVLFAVELLKTFIPCGWLESCFECVSDERLL